jgi:hypothetical protein
MDEELEREWREAIEAFLRAEPGMADVLRQLVEGVRPRGAPPLHRLDQMDAALRDMDMALGRGDYATAHACLKLFAQMLADE